MQYTAKKALPHIISILLLFIVVLTFYYPILEGRSLSQSDMVQVKGSLKEANDYASSGEAILWSNSSFSGMPVWRGFKTSIIDNIHYFLVDHLSVPIYLALLSYIGFYILMLAFRVNPWVSTGAAFAYTFSSFTIISLEAGHINKVLDMALMAPVLAGVVLIYRQKFWTGILTLLISGGLLIYYGHIQIIYYLLIIILFYVITQFYLALKAKRLKSFFISSTIAAVTALLAAAPSYSRLAVLAEYANSTTRAGSELATNDESSGLSKEYTFDWSYGIPETFTFLIPDFYGGSSHENVGINSNTFKTLVQAGVPRSQAMEYVKALPTYWGNQPFTSGPVYFGATVLFLFVIGLILIKSPTKWWIIGVSILALMLSWGENLEFVSLLFYKFIPLYNKFRSVTMILTILQVTIPLLGFIALNKIIKNNKIESYKALQYSIAIVGGVLLFFLVVGTGLFDFTSKADSQLPSWLAKSIIEDRKGMFKSDVFRSLFFVIATFLLIWFYLKEKIKKEWMLAGIILLVVTDLFSVDKRYLSADEFVKKADSYQQIFSKTPADEQILKDTSYYRVYNLSVNPFSDAITSYYHKSIGGYSAIKLRRYQDIIDYQLSKNNQKVLDMLNTKYFIYKNQKTGSIEVAKNQNALGNAWFVSYYKIVSGAKEEMEALSSFNPRTIAIVDERFKNLLKGLPKTDTLGSIKITGYNPNWIKYVANTSERKLAVFSEIFYEPGWQAYIDGKPVDHLRVNYVLRGLVVPAGKHNIKFVFEPQTYYQGEKISLIGSIIWTIACLVTLGLAVFKKEEEKDSEDDEPD